jgi:hypothetical protein
MGGMISQELSLLLLPQERLASLVLAVTHAGTDIPLSVTLQRVLNRLRYRRDGGGAGGLYATAPMAGVLGMMTSIFKKTADEKADICTPLF